jgi:hypothetical protein
VNIIQSNALFFIHPNKLEKLDARGIFDVLEIPPPLPKHSTPPHYPKEERKCQERKNYEKKCCV